MHHHCKAEGQYIRPIADEIAALIVEGEGLKVVGTDVILKKIIGNIRRIYGNHPSYMTLQYMLLFSFEIVGWVRDIPLADGSSS